MSDLKVGQKVIAVHRQRAGSDIIEPGHIGVVTDIDGKYVSIDNLKGADGALVMFVGAFKPYEETFKVGDRVRVICASSHLPTGGSDGYFFKVGCVGTIKSYNGSDSGVVQFDEGQDCNQSCDRIWSVAGFAITKISQQMPEKVVDKPKEQVQTTPTKTKQGDAKMKYAIQRGYTKVEAPKTYKAGVEFLDKIFPEWYNSIDLTKFDMSSFDTCIIGQLARHTEGNYSGRSFVEVLFADSRCCYGNKSIFGSCPPGKPATRTNDANHTSTWREIIEQKRMENASPLAAQLAAAKDKVAEIEAKIAEEARKHEEVTIKLTRAEIDQLLSRKVGGLKDKILKQIA